jgi:hypothetical protein
MACTLSSCLGVAGIKICANERPVAVSAQRWPGLWFQIFVSRNRTSKEQGEHLKADTQLQGPQSLVFERPVASKTVNAALLFHPD